MSAFSRCRREDHKGGARCWGCKSTTAKEPWSWQPSSNICIWTAASLCISSIREAGQHQTGAHRWHVMKSRMPSHRKYLAAPGTRPCQELRRFHPSWVVMICLHPTSDMHITQAPSGLAEQATPARGQAMQPLSATPAGRLQGNALFNINAHLGLGGLAAARAKSPPKPRSLVSNRMPSIGLISYIGS